jgi:hypothetical protein
MVMHVWRAKQSSAMTTGCDRLDEMLLAKAVNWIASRTGVQA